MNTNIFRIILFTIPIVAFNVLLFLIGDTAKFNTSTWVAYGAIHLAWITCLCTPLLFNRDDHPVNTYVLSGITTGFFALQMVVGIIIILINPESYVWMLIIEVLLFVGFLLLLFGNAWGNCVTAKEERERVENKKQVMQHNIRVKLLVTKCKDMELRHELQACYDQLLRVPVKNSAAADSVDTQIDSLLTQMERTMLTTETAGNLVEELKSLIAQREQILRLTH